MLAHFRVARPPVDGPTPFGKPRDYKHPVVESQTGCRVQHSLMAGVRPALEAGEVDDDRPGSAGHGSADRSGEAVNGLVAEIAGQRQNTCARCGHVVPLDCHAAPFAACRQNDPPSCV